MVGAREKAGKRLSDYNMEAQGNVLSDYWALRLYGSPPQMWNAAHRGDLALFEQVLAQFIADPSDVKSLPGGRQ